MNLEDLLKMWADWYFLPNKVVLYMNRHPLARLIDGVGGSKPIYCSHIPSGVVINDNIAARVEMAIAKLSKAQKVVIFMEYLKNGYQDEKAQKLCLSVEAYRMRLLRAKKNLSLTLKYLINE